MYIQSSELTILSGYLLSENWIFLNIKEVIRLLVAILFK